MTKSKIVFSVAAFLFVCLLSLTDLFAQTPTNKLQAQPSYEVVLQTVVGSNAGGAKTDVPQTLAGIVKKLKTNYEYSNYRLDSTMLQRVGERGAVESKSISNETGAMQEKNLTIFSDWRLNGLQLLTDANGQKLFQFEDFRFGQRIPIVTNSFKDANGKDASVVNYEQVGLTIQRSSFSENTPTVIGSLSTTKPDELMFLILTVKSAD